ncbi:hypothetical protein PHYPSEUDO_000822 [Phytophthora pseudosyringae]|uniref:Uncharacterized protein n=1 Tax=Phytophthora pseudosyringae TaxID=221518 RepID=A0A8T1WJ57_9STRA|nr:hypothetical protein PHYPSEUDO_000822 [Phytophthora pseudosyringae]
MDARNANLARKPRHFEGQARHTGKFDLPNESSNEELLHLSKQKSPYRQQLRRPKPPAPSPGSPAQRAARSILKLKEGLLHIDGAKWPGDTGIQDDHGVELARPQGVQQPVRVRSSPKSIDSALTTPSLGTSSARSPSRANTPVRSPSRKKKTRAEHELAQKQERLAAWLHANPDAGPDSVVEDAGQRFKGDDAPTDTNQLYSVEVEARIESAIQCRGPLEAGVRLWDDPVRSMLAAEMTSESVFGGAVPTQALAFQSPERPPPSRASPPMQASSANDTGPLEVAVAAAQHEQLSADEVAGSAASEPQLSDHAQKVFGVAHRQAADGAVADALATLEAGIRQSLSASQARLDAVSGAHGAGFNYSVLAHKSATRLQLYYRARHRQRVNRLILLQRQWRWWHTRRRVLKSLHFANEQAMVIQHRYRSWHVHITQVRSAVRIQRCFRVFESQKFLIHFQQVCRLLLARQARSRRVKTRMRMLGKVVLLFRKRRRRIALIQGLWRRRCAQAQLVTLLARVSAVELGRRAREDAFVAEKLDQARLRFRAFLRSTKRGRELVRWQAEKPWLRFRRLRNNTRHWDELPLPEKVAAAARILPTRNFRGVHQLALCQMLVGTDQQLPPLPKALKVSAEELAFLATPSTDSDTRKSLEPAGCCVCFPWQAVVRETMKRSRAKLSRRVATLWWAVVTYPKEYCAARMWPIRKRQRELARQQLEDDFARVLTAFLRAWFRRSKANTPPYSCEWCSEPFGTSREFFAHGKCAAARGRAEAEWAALSSDLQFARRTKWRFSKQPHEDAVRMDSHAFDLKAASVRRLRRTHSRREALIPLVATLEACTAGDSPNAVVPMDLAAFVLKYLDDSKTSHPLMQTAEHQLVRWGTLVGAMEVENSSQTPEGSGRESRWVRKDNLRSRLVAGSKWSSILSRLRRSLSRRALKYRPVPTENAVALTLKATRGFVDRATSKWKELELRIRGIPPRRRRQRDTKADQQEPTSPSAVGARVLPVAT